MAFNEVRALGGCPIGLFDGLWMSQSPDGTCRQLEASQGLVTLLEHEPTTLWYTLASDLDDKAGGTVNPYRAALSRGRPEE